MYQEGGQTLEHSPGAGVSVGGPNWHCSRGIWTMPSVMRFSFGQAVGPNDPCESLPTEIFQSSLV